MARNHPARVGRSAVADGCGKRAAPAAARAPARCRLAVADDGARARDGGARRLVGALRRCGESAADGRLRPRQSRHRVDGRAVDDILHPRGQRARPRLRARGGLRDGRHARIRRRSMAALTTRLLLSALLVAVPAGAAVRVVDDTGATVALAAPATRIITLAPHAAELVYAAGAGARVVGVMKGSDYPPAAAKLPVIGDVAALDLEKIVMLAPDLIVTWPWTTPAQVAWLRARGVAVFEADAHTIDGI